MKKLEKVLLIILAVLMVSIVSNINVEESIQQFAHTIENNKPLASTVTFTLGKPTGEMYANREGAFTINVSGITGTTLESNFEVKISGGGSDATSNFTINKTSISNKNMTITISKTASNIAAGAYTVSVTAGGTPKTVNFNVKKNYYDFSITSQLQTHYPNNPSNKPNEWKINITKSYITDTSAFSIKITKDGTNFTDRFTTTFENDGYTVKNKTSGFSNRPKAGTYTISISYNKGDSENGTITRTVNITIGGRTLELNQISAESHRYEVVDEKNDFDLYVLSRSDGNIKFTEGDKEQTLSVSDFFKKYGIELLDNIFDDDGNVVFFNGEVTITKLTADKITYIDGDSYEHADEDLNTFKSTHEGVIDELNKNFTHDENGTLKYHCTGQYVSGERKLSTENRTIFARQGGFFEYHYQYSPDELTDEDFDSSHVKLLVYGEDGKTTFGSNVGFDAKWEKEENNNTIKITLDYTNTNDKYAGNYFIQLTFEDAEPLNIGFALYEGEIDYYVTSQYDQHLGAEDQIDTKPPANRNYEYYLGLHLIRSGVEENTRSDKQISVRIFDHLVDYDAHNALYYYNNVDYVLEIKSKKDNNVTFAVTINDKKESKTLTVEEFKKQYADAAELLDKYVFGADGNINSSTDNFDLRITKFYSDPQKNDMMVEFTPKNQNKQTLSLNDFKLQYPDMYGYLVTRFNFDEEGNIRTGVITGSYRVLLDDNQAPIKGNEVTDQFDITINPDPDETEKAITVLPHTEVDAGTYYVYVGYDVLGSIGYINNKEDAAISKKLYPEMWEQNIHMTSIDYLAADYDVTIGEPELSNIGNEEHKMYDNIQGEADFIIDPEFIYDEEGFDFKVFKGESDVTNNFTINSDNILDESHLLTLTTDNDGVDQGTYKLKITYEHNGQECEDEKEFTVSGKYYELDIRDMSYLTFIHNYTEKHNIPIDTYFVEHAENITPKIKRVVDGISDEPLTLNKDQKNFTDGNGNVVFTYNYKFEKVGNERRLESVAAGSSQADLDEGVYTFELSNVADKAKEGTYEIEFTYQEDTNDLVDDELEFQVSEDSFNFSLSEERAEADDTSMRVLKTIQTDYITRTELDKLTFKVMYYDKNQHDYVDVSSNDANKKMFNVTKGWNDNQEDKKNYTGTLSLTLNTGVVDMDGSYIIEGSYRNHNIEFEMGNLRELFDWKITDVKISGKFATGTGDIDVDKLFTNIKEGKIDVTIDSVHSNNVKWAINSECLKVLTTENGTCDPDTGTNYNSHFDETNKTGSEKNLSLSLKNDKPLEAGEYALVLYYSSTDYQVYKLQVYHEYVTIELGEATINTKIDETRSSKEFYKNKETTLEIPVTIYGIEYKNATITITDNEGEEFNDVFPHEESVYTDEHKLKITYKPNGGGKDIHAGEYTLKVSNTNADGEVSDTYTFYMHNSYFNFDIEEPKYTPDPIYPNPENGGKIVYRVDTEDIANVTAGENGRDDLSKKHEFARQTMIRDEDGQDVTDEFMVKAQNIEASESSLTDFDLVVGFEKMAVEPGSYDIYVSYTSEGDTITREGEFTINDYAKNLKVDGIDVESPTKDGKVHNNVGGKYIIRYSSDFELNRGFLTASISSEQEIDLTKMFNITVYTDYIEVVYTPGEPLIQSGDYTIKVKYDEGHGHIPFEAPIKIHLYGTYKELILSNLQKKSEPVYADKEGNGYTFDINYETLTDPEKSKLKAKIFDADGNVVYSDFEEDEEKEDCFEVDNKLLLDAKNMEINIIPFKAMVGKYRIIIYLENESQEYNESNALEFEIDRTYYKVELDDASTIKPKVIYQGKSDAIYDRDGADGNYIFTTTYNEDDLSDYSIKVLKNVTLVKEITDLKTTKDNDKITSTFALTDLEPGEYKVALCINGLPYAWKTITVNKYIPVTSAKIYINYQELKDTGTYNVGDKLNIRYDYEPQNATNPNLTFTVDDKKIAEVNGSFIIFSSVGTTTLKLSNDDITVEKTISTRQLLSSSKYDIRRNGTKIIYVNTMNFLSLTKNEFMSNLTGVVSGYKILDTHNKDITNTTQNIGTGMTFVNGNEQFKIAVIGDTNGSGTINLGDVAHILQYIRHKVSVSDEATLLAMRVRKDNSITLGDVSKLFQFYRRKTSSI